MTKVKVTRLPHRFEGAVVGDIGLVQGYVPSEEFGAKAIVEIKEKLIAIPICYLCTME